MTKQRTCRHCGGEIDPGHGDREGKTHFNHFECIGVLRGRAEEAEARVAQLEAAQRGWNGFELKPQHGQQVEVREIRIATYYADDDLWSFDDDSTHEAWRPLSVAESDQ